MDHTRNDTNLCRGMTYLRLWSSTTLPDSLGVALLTEPTQHSTADWTDCSRSRGYPTPTRANTHKHTGNRQQCNDSSEPDITQQWRREVGTTASFQSMVKDFIPHKESFAASDNERWLVLRAGTFPFSNYYDPPWLWRNGVLQSSQSLSTATYPWKGESTAHITNSMCIPPPHKEHSFVPVRKLQNLRPIRKQCWIQCGMFVVFTALRSLGAVLISECSRLRSSMY
jgi:hypothetical protein